MLLDQKMYCVTDNGNNGKLYELLVHLRDSPNRISRFLLTSSECILEKNFALIVETEAYFLAKDKSYYKNCMTAIVAVSSSLLFRLETLGGINY